MKKKQIYIAPQMTVVKVDAESCILYVSNALNITNYTEEETDEEWGL